MFEHCFCPTRIQLCRAIGDTTVTPPCEVRHRLTTAGVGHGGTKVSLRKVKHEFHQSPLSILGGLNGVELTGQAQPFPAVRLFGQDSFQEMRRPPFGCSSASFYPEKDRKTEPWHFWNHLEVTIIQQSVRGSPDENLVYQAQLPWWSTPAW